jgi:hypothetical protein
MVSKSHEDEIRVLGMSDLQCPGTVITQLTRLDTGMRKGGEEGERAGVVTEAAFK